MPYPPLSALAFKRTVVEAISAASQFDFDANDGRIVYYSIVTDLITGQSTRHDFGFSIPSSFLISRAFSRKLKVRVYAQQKRHGRIDVIGVSPQFRHIERSGKIDLISPSDVAADLSLRLKIHLTHKPYRRFTSGRVLSSNPRPSTENVRHLFPNYYFDGPGVGFSGNDTIVDFNRQWSGVRTPEYLKLKKKKRLPINNHHVRIMERKDYGSYFQEDWLDSPGYGTGYMHSYTRDFGSGTSGPTFGIAHASKQRNKAVQRLYEHAVGETSNLSESVATINQTLRMFSDTFRNIHKAVKDLRAGRFLDSVNGVFGPRPRKFRYGKKIPTFTNNLTNNWLELQFGWKPLLGDISYGIEAIGKVLLAEQPVAWVRSSAKSKEDVTYDLRPNAGPNSIVVGKCVYHTETTTRFMARFRVQSHLHAFLSQSGFTNPVSLAWELLPFSFVVDWLYPVGSYLESLSMWGGLEFLDGVETTFTRMSADYLQNYSGTSFPVPVAVPTRYSQLYGGYSQRGILLDRTKLSAFPTLSPPTFKNPFSVVHALDALALVKQAFRS